MFVQQAKHTGDNWTISELYFWTPVIPNSSGWQTDQVLPLGKEDEYDVDRRVVGGGHLIYQGLDVFFLSDFTHSAFNFWIWRCYKVYAELTGVRHHLSVDITGCTDLDITTELLFIIAGLPNSVFVFRATHNFDATIELLKPHNG